MSQDAEGHVVKAKPLWKRRWVLLSLIVVGLVAAMAINVILKLRGGTHDAQTIRGIVASEELILELTPELKRLSRSVLNLKLPDHDGGHLFGESVAVIDLQPDSLPEPTGTIASVSLRSSTWPIETAEHSTDKTALGLWRPLFAAVDYFEHAKFYFVRGNFVDESLQTFEAEVGFAGLARTRAGTLRAVTAQQTVLWRRGESSDGAEEAAWQIIAWRQKSLDTVDGQKPLFSEVLDVALPDADDLARARTSEHQKQVIRYYASGGEQLPSRYFTPISANQKPGLAVVDIDGDGWDDLYVMVRSGRNMLLRNRGDGTFEEAAGRFGLDFRGNSTCGIFADFDNDGDLDLMLGRSLEKSMYLENRGGRFINRSGSIGGEPLPALAVSMSAADYNGDGLLDVYICTYRPAAMESILSGGEFSESSAAEGMPRDAEGASRNPFEDVAAQASNWPHEFLSKEEAAEFISRSKAERRTGDRFKNVLNQLGPPNVLLVNRGGGRFERAPENEQVGLWRNTLQATFGDYDDDGDVDLYIANDWAPDHLFRNDGPDGFVDVTLQAGTAHFGFAMGASWGDYDNDGRQDLYVSNMYSKAGRRITSQISDLNPDYGRSVEGNYLYRNVGEKFDLVSGQAPPAMTVAKAGWSWGGQFADLNNDAYLDLYVLSGYFTPPPGFASDLDL